MHARVLIAPVLTTLVTLAACSTPPPPQGAAPATKATPTVSRAPFGTLPDGTAIESFTFANANGIEIRAITLGGIIVSLRTPDRTGALADIALGFDAIDGYLVNSPTSAPSSGATAIASRRAASRSTARPTSWRSTMAPTTCTVA